MGAPSRWLLLGCALALAAETSAWSPADLLPDSPPSAPEVLHAVRGFFLYLFASTGGLIVFVIGAGLTFFVTIPYILVCWLKCAMGADKVQGGGLQRAFGMV
jgi:hypothetical protein